MTELLNSLEIYAHYLVFFFTLTLFTAYTYKTYSDMPKEEDISRKWLLSSSDYTTQCI